MPIAWNPWKYWFFWTFISPYVVLERPKRPVNTGWIEFNAKAVSGESSIKILTMAWTYYKTPILSLSSPDSGKIVGIIRADLQRGIFERYDRLTGEFVPSNFSMAKVTGIGGAAGEAILTTEEYAKRKIAKWQEED